MKKLSIGLALLIVVCSLAQAQNTTAFVFGTRLAEWASSYERVQANRIAKPYDMAYAGLFNGYVTGVADTLREEGQFKAPLQATDQQLASIVSKYLRDNPANWTHKAVSLVTDALRQAFSQ
jgi:hypothetical protein